MGKPKPPAPPNPVETSAAQTGTNVSTTIANNMMAAMNQATPYGSITYDQTGSYTWTDPYTGETYEVPTLTATQTYTPEQQAIADQQMAASTSMATTAANQADFLQDYLGDDFNPDIAFADVPDPVRQQQIDLGKAPKPQKLQKGVFGADAKTQIANVGSVDRGNAQGGRVQTDVNGVDLQNKLDNAGTIKTNVNNAGDITTRGANEGPLTKNIYGADYQKRVAGQDAVQNVRGADYQKKVAGQDAVQGFNTGEGVVDTYSGDFSKDRRRVENALMERMNPQIERDRENMRAQMANSGISIGSDAYSASNEDFQRGINDARLGAIMAGGQEQSRMVGLEADRAAFTNAARGQQYNQNLGAAAFRNDARAQDFQQNLAQGQFANQANAQQFGQNMAQGQFTNQARAQDFQQNLAQGQFANQANQAQFGQNMAQGNFANNAQAQAFQQQLANSQFANQAQAQQYDQNLSDTNVRNDAQAQQFGQNLAGGTFANQAANDQFAQQMAQGNFANQAQAQLYGQDAANIDRGNAAQQQAFNQAQIRTDTANAARDQNFQQNLAQAGFSNQALSAQYAQQMAAYDAANQAQMSEAGFNNNAMNQQFGQQMATANMTDAQRQQQLQEMFALRNQPINEISALMSGSQLQGPNFNPQNPQPMPTTDVAGNIWNNYNGQMNNYNQQMAANGSMWGNLFGALPLLF